MIPEFESFPKIPRVKDNILITEKIDGTNAQVVVTSEGEVQAGSRNRYIYPHADNYGFAAWVEANKEELLCLGVGRHFGEWYGVGIQRNYNLKEKRFALFIPRPSESLPSCVSCVPVVYSGPSSTEAVNGALEALRNQGSLAVPGFMRPEGIVIWNAGSRTRQKITFENDNRGKYCVPDVP